MAALGGRLSKLLLTGLGAVGGGTAVFLWRPTPDAGESAALSPASAATEPISFGKLTTFVDGIPSPTTKWDPDWDRRLPKSLVEPPKNKSPEELKDDEAYQEALTKKKCHARRHLIMIRHGQYNLDGATDDERFLTELGHKQAALTGDQLASMGFKYGSLVRSTMTRAMQTSEAIVERLPAELKVVSTDLLREGAPFPPEPTLHFWKPGPRRFYEDSARIEAAFRKFVHRAPPEQDEDSFEILVCHANVIRYFVCRALQLPPEAWARISLRHASITQITVLANGRVKLDCLGDAGFMPVDARTTT